MKNFIFITLFLLLASAAWAEDKIFVYNDHAKRDPMRSLVDPNGNILNFDNDFLVTDLTLQGIVVDANGHNLAIINGRIVRTNETIGQYVVGVIGKDTVELIKGQEKFELKLQKED